MNSTGKQIYYFIIEKLRIRLKIIIFILDYAYVLMSFNLHNNHVNRDYHFIDEEMWILS